MFGFIKKMFIVLFSVCTIGRFGESLAFNSKGPIKCISLDNQSYQTKPGLVDIISNETLIGKELVTFGVIIILNAKVTVIETKHYQLKNILRKLNHT